MSLDKIRNTLLYSVNVDQDTKDLPVSEEIINQSDEIVDITAAESINSVTVLDQDYDLNADFKAEPIPTNERINTDELNKIKNTSVYTTGLTDDQKTKQLDLVDDIYIDVTTGVVPPDLEKYGFAGFNIEAGDDSTTGFENLNFTKESGFSVTRPENDPTKLNIKHNGFGKVYINGNYLTADLSDTLSFKGDGLNLSVETNEFNQKFVVIDNKYVSVESLDDVALTNPLQEEELLMQQGGKLKNFNSREIRPLTVYGGEF